MLKIIKKIFGEKPTEEKKEIKIEMEKTSKMLDENKFWDIIHLSLKETDNQEKQEDLLIQEIEKLSLNEIVGFRLKTDKLLYDTYTSEMWCAGYIMNGGCSDDCFAYFRNWVISRGKEVYYEAKKNPDTLVEEFVDNRDYYEFEGFGYVALKAFENRTGGSLYDYISEDFDTREGNYPEMKFNWEEGKPETMKAICPKLFGKFNEER